MSRPRGFKRVRTGRTASSRIGTRGPGLVVLALGALVSSSLAWIRPASGEVWVHWTDREDFSIHRAEASNAAASLSTPVTGLSDPRGLRVHPDTGQLYWVDQGLHVIRRSNFDGSSPSDVVTGLDIPQDLALDVVNGKIYWIESGATDRILRADLNGSNVEPIIDTGLAGLRGIALDVAGGRMYWTQAGASAGIFRANLNGSGKQALATANLTFPVGIALDIPRGKVYWADSDNNTATEADTLERANLDGTQREALVKTGTRHPRYIAVDGPGNKLYWTDSALDGIFRSNLDGSGVEQVVSDSPSPQGVQVIPFVCATGGVTQVCSGGPNAGFNALSIPSNNVTYSWSISGNGSIVGSTTGSSVTVSPGSPGQFTITVVASRFGCTSTSSHTVTVNPVPSCSISGPEPVCASTGGYTYAAQVDPTGGTVTYAWSISGNGSISGPANGSTVTVSAGAAGSFTLTLNATRAGCATSCTRTVTVNARPNCSVSGPSGVCPNTTGIQFSSTVTPADGVEYFWSVLGDAAIGNLGNRGPTVLVDSGPSGFFAVQLQTTRFGCQWDCEKLVQIIPGITCSVSGSNEVCSSSTRNLYTSSIDDPLSGTVTYAWSVVGNGTISGSATGSSVTVDAGAPGSYTVTLGVTRNGCSSTCTQVVTVNPVPSCSIQGPDPVCASTPGIQYASSVAPPGGTVVYDWSVTGNATIPGATDGSSVTVNAGAAGSYTLTLEVTRNGCVTSCSKVVTVNESLVCSITGPPGVCTNEQNSPFSASVTPADNVSYDWSISGNGSIQGATNGSSVVVDAGSVGSYTLTLEVSRNGCVSSCTKTVAVNPIPSCSISGADAVCASTGRLVYTSSVAPPGGAVTYAWSVVGNGTISGSATGSSVTVDAGAPGSYTVTLEVTRNGCSNTCTQAVTVNPVPSCSIQGPDPVCASTPGIQYASSVAPSGGTVVYDWSVTGNATIPGANDGSSVTVNAGAAGSYTLTLEVTRNGCVTSCSKAVTANESLVCSIEGSSSVCAEPESTTFRARVTPADEIAYAWSVSGAGSIRGSASDSLLTVMAGPPGSYTLTLDVVRRGCAASCTTVVQVHGCEPDSLTISTTPGLFHSISIPLEAEGGGGGIEVGLLGLGLPDARNWRLGHYEPTQLESNKYSEAAGGMGRVRPGLGYWLITKSGQSLRTSGLAVTDSDFSMPLEGGAGAWSQLGNPFVDAAGMPVGSLQVSTPGGAVSLFAPSNTWTEQAIHLWNETIQEYETVDFDGLEGVIPRASAFWVRKLAPEETVLHMGLDAVGSPALAASSTLRPQVHWSIEITARQGSRRATTLRVGAADVPPDGWNPLDLSLPPSPPGRHLTLAIPKPDWGDRSGRYLREFQPPAAALSWVFELDGADAPGEVVLDLQGLRLPPQASPRLTEIGGELDQVVRPGEPVTLAALERPRAFRLTVGGLDNSTRAPVLPSLSAYPNPFAGRTGFRFAGYPADALLVTIYDLQGRRIRELGRSTPSAGENVLVWDGNDEAGQRASPGVYFVHYRIGARTGSLRIVKLD